MIAAIMWSGETVRWCEKHVGPIVSATVHSQGSASGGSAVLTITVHSFSRPATQTDDGDSRSNTCATAQQFPPCHHWLCHKSQGGRASKVHNPSRSTQMLFRKMLHFRSSKAGSHARQAVLQDNCNWWMRMPLPARLV